MKAATERARRSSSRPASAATPGHNAQTAAVQQLQRLAGNAAVAKAVRSTGRSDMPPLLALQRNNGGVAVADAPTRPISEWTRDEVKPIQRELRRLRLYTMRIDGIAGRGTQAALVEAFGGDQWQQLAPAQMLSRLAAAASPTGAAQRTPRYGELFKDGVLDVTLGVGFMEEINPATGQPFLVEALAQFRTSFAARGFANDADRAAQIMAASGRGLGPSAFGEFYVKPDAFTYRPPAGDERSIHTVIRLVAGGENQGAQAAGAFQEAMTGGDVSYYTGHGRYGTGPDFDRNFIRFTLLDARGNVEQVLDDYEVLARVLRRESGGNAWNRFLWRERRGRIQVEVANAGNLRLAARNAHPGEFGARLLHWAMARSGTEPITGRDGALAQGAAAQPDRRYRIMVFDGCRTRDYDRSIRSTPGFDTHTTDMIQTRRTVGFGAIVEAFLTFLDSVMGQQSAAEVIREMNQTMVGHEEGHPGSAAFVGSGFGDNPQR